MRPISMLVLVACAASPKRPAVELRALDDAPAYERAVDVWSPLGFVAADGTPPCPRDWYASGEVDCTIAIRLERAELNGTGRLGYALRGEGIIVIDAALDGDVLVWAVAHEIGHVVLDSGEHLSPGQVGIMGSDVPIVRLTNADRELACKLRSWCD